ncbi:MAG: hypothetical protein M5R36_06875 [Deltaproteobacteria bacterium]|nr:hypothetical protein [Deltaproteobacteria bacterium]
MISVNASPDGRYFASAGKDGLVNVYDMENDKLVTRIDMEKYMPEPKATPVDPKQIERE